MAAIREEAAEARERGAPPGVPTKCWWRESIARSTLQPVPLHPEPLDLGPGGLEAFKTALDALRSKAGGYLCPWCPTGQPKRYKYVSRAVHHFATKHSELWAALGEELQAELVASTPSVWEAAFAIMPLLPSTAPGSTILDFLANLRERMTEEPDAAPDPQTDGAPLQPPPAPLLLPPAPAPASVPLPVNSSAPPTTSSSAPAPLPVALSVPTAPVPSLLLPVLAPARAATAPMPRASLHVAIPRSSAANERKDEDSRHPLPTPAAAVDNAAQEPVISTEASEATSYSPLIASDASEGAQRRRKHTLEPAESKRRTQPRLRYSPPGSPRRPK